jgi:hypothetical protein
MNLPNENPASFCLPFVETVFACCFAIYSPFSMLSWRIALCPLRLKIVLQSAQ